MKTIDRDGYNIRIEIRDDSDMGPPWEEHDGHGIVSGWTSRDKRPGERVLCSDRLKRYYDFAATLLVAKRDGWGLSVNDIEKLGVRLGRTPTAREVLAESVERDFAYLKGWCDDSWHWVGYVTTITAPDGAELPQDSCWGYDDEAYAISEAESQAVWTVAEHQKQTAIESTEAQAMACRDITTV